MTLTSRSFKPARTQFTKIDVGACVRVCVRVCVCECSISMLHASEQTIIVEATCTCHENFDLRKASLKLSK